MASLDNYPALSELLANRPAPQAPQNRRGWLGPGVSAGIDQFQALSGRGLQAVGDLVGSQTVSDVGAGIAERNFAEAARNGRTDLESFPTDDLTKAPAWLGYQLAKQLPNIAASALAYKLGGRAAARFTPAAAAELGAVAPTWLGGGGLRAGMTAAATQVAQAQGARMAAGVLAQAPVMFPQAVGSLYNEAVEAGNAGPGTAALSLLGGVPYSLAEGFAPATLGKALARGAEKGFLKRVATGAFTNAAQETVTEGAQTAMEQAFRPDLPIRERMANVVAGAVTGGVLGGVFGGVSGGIGGMRAVKTADPSQLSNDKLKQTVDQTLTPPALEADATGQFTMPGLDARMRPATGAQNFMGGADPTPDFTAGSRVNITNFPITPAGEEFGRTVQGPFRSEATVVPPAPAAERQGIGERRVYPYNTPGTARWGRYEDVGGLYGYEAAQQAAAQMGEVAADTGPRPSNPDQGIFDFRAPEGGVMPERASPKRIAELMQRFRNNEATQQDRALVARLGLETPASANIERAEVEAKEDPKLAKDTADLIGGTKTLWQRAVLSQPAQDMIDRVAQVSEVVGQFVNGNVTMPASLIKAGQRIGVLDEQGLPQDPRTVRDQLVARRDELLNAAQLTGQGMGEAKAATRAVKEWDAKVSALAQATQRIEARAAAARQALDASAQAVGQQESIPEGPRPSTLAETVETLRGAPPVMPAPSLGQRFQQRGIAPSQGQVETSAPVVTQQSKAQARKAAREASALAAQQQAAARDASGTQYQNLDQRLRGQVPRAAGVAPTQVDPQARAAAALGLTVPPAAAEPGTQVVTAQDVASKRRLQRQRRKEREAAARERVVPPPAPVQSPLAAGTSVGSVNARAAAAIDEQRQSVLRRLDAVANDASLDEVGQQGLRQEAVAAAQAYAAGAQGSDKAAYKVLAAHGKATGGTVLSSRPTSERTPPMSEQAFNQELLRIAKTLPQAAREAIIPVNTAQELPPEVLEAARNQGMHPTEIRGALHDGKVYVVAENVSTVADLQEVINHEIFGHGGARALLGDQRGAVLTRVWEMVGGLEGLRALARKFGVEAQLNLYLPGRDFTAADKINLTDELLAQVAGKTSGKWKTFLMAWASRFKSALINALSAMGLQTTAERLNTFTPVDMAEMIVRMREAVLLNGDISGKGVQFSKDVQNSAEFKKWFEGSYGTESGKPDGSPPKVFYHGTSKDADFKSFRTGPRGIWFTSNPAGASIFAETNDSQGYKTGPGWTVTPTNTAARVIPAYLSYKNPHVVTDAEKKLLYKEGDYRAAQRELFSKLRAKDPTIDAIDFGGGVVTVFDPKQIKSVFNEFKDGASESTAFLRTTPQGMGESLQNLSKTADNVWSWVNNASQTETRLQLNRFHLYTSTIGHIVSTFGKLFEYTDSKTGQVVNPLKKFWDAHVMRGVAEQRMAHAIAKSYNDFEALLLTNPKAAEQMNSLMRYTFDMIDPRKPWSDHTWLRDSKNPANEARAKAKVAEANNLYRSLNEPNNTEGNRVIAAYQTFIDSNEGMHFAQQAMSLFNLMTSDKEIAQSLKDKLERENPMDEFLQKADTYDNTKATRDYWEAKTKQLVEQAEAYLRAQNELANTVDKTSAEKIEKNTSSLKARLRSINSEQQAMKQAPYFHLGRFGDWVLSFHIPVKDGKADPAAMDAIADRFREAGINGIEIPRDATRANAFIRFESKAERDAAQKIALELAQKKLVLNEGNKKIKTFMRSDDAAMRGFDISKMPQWAQGLMDKIRAKEFGKIEGLSEEDKKLVARLNNEFERHVSQYFLDLLPDTSLTKVMVHRNNVPGFSTDMMRSQLFRAQVAGRALANLYAAGKMSEARAGMLERVYEARSDADTTRAQITQNVASELFLRDSQRPKIEKNTWVDVTRAINHAYFLGMTPAYPIVNLTQIGVLLWPELSKKHGFVNAAKAIGKVTPIAIKVLRAVWSEARKSGWKNLPDASINTQVLKTAGLTGSQADFVMRIVNSGILDIGSQSREIGRIVEGQQFSKMDNALRWASMFGYYSEMASRLVAALSARELHGGYDEKMYKYVDDTVRQSMLSYETWNQARATGKLGLLGEYTPIMTSLMQYTFQLTEKLYREFHDGFMDSSLSAKEKAEARTFLGTHLAAIVALTGTLGMPMASVFAGVFDLLANSIWKDDDDEPMNIRVAYRNWLTDVFGDTAGDVMARGLPRVMGVDLSARAGEQDLLPYAHIFSKLLTDKREWKDKVAEDTFRSLGAPISMANSIISGGSQFLNGNYMDGMIEMMPPAIKGPLKAAKLTTDGYVDQKGNRIPIMTPGTIDVLAQALGFNPANNAEYQESKNDQRVLRGAMTKKASQLRENLAVALEEGDMVAAQEYLRAAQEFDAKNPEFAIMKSMKQVLRNRAREREKSRESGAPLGVKPELADRTRYGIQPD